MDNAITYFWRNPYVPKKTTICHNLQNKSSPKSSDGKSASLPHSVIAPWRLAIFSLTLWLHNKFCWASSTVQSSKREFQCGLVFAVAGFIFVLLSSIRKTSLFPTDCFRLDYGCCSSFECAAVDSLASVSPTAPTAIAPSLLVTFISGNTYSVLVTAYPLSSHWRIDCA